MNFHLKTNKIKSSAKFRLISSIASIQSSVNYGFDIPTVINHRVLSCLRLECCNLNKHKESLVIHWNTMSRHFHSIELPMCNVHSAMLCSVQVYTCATLFQQMNMSMSSAVQRLVSHIDGHRANSTLLTNDDQSIDFSGEKDGFVQVGPKKYLFPSTFAKHAEHFYNFQARHDDIWIATFPRSGTTWTQELVWMIANDLDYDRAQRELLTKRSPFFE